MFRVDIGEQQPTPDAEIAELRWVTAATASAIEIAPLAREYFLRLTRRSRRPLRQQGPHARG